MIQTQSLDETRLSVWAAASVVLYLKPKEEAADELLLSLIALRWKQILLGLLFDEK